MTFRELQIAKSLKLNYSNHEKINVLSRLNAEKLLNIFYKIIKLEYRETLKSMNTAIVE